MMPIDVSPSKINYLPILSGQWFLFHPQSFKHGFLGGIVKYQAESTD
jgi:hypothetical protein